MECKNDERIPNLNLIYVTQHFFPEIGAASSRATELINHFKKESIISIITSVPNYPFGKVYKGYENKNEIEKYSDNVTVYRAKIKISEKKGKINRAINYFSFWKNAIKISKKLTSGDIVIGTIGPIFVADIAYKISKNRKIPFVLEIRDLTYKQVLATKYGSNTIAKIIKSYEVFYAKKADLIISLTKGYKKDLMRNNIRPNKIKVIENGFDFSSKKNREKVDSYNYIKSKLDKYENKFGYFGTLGISQDIYSFVKKFRKIDNSAFIIFGQGAQYNKIKNYIEENNIKNIFLYPSIKENKLINFYNIIDYSLVILKNHLEFKDTIPSKIFKIMGFSSIPVFIGPDGEASRIVKMIDNRLHIKNISELKLLSNIKNEEKNKLRVKAYNICFKNFNRANQAIRYVDYLKGIIKNK